MPVTPTDAVRAFQLPTPSTEQPYLSQFNLGNSNQPISVTPGFGGGSGPPTPVQTAQSHFDSTTTFYVVAAQSEIRTTPS